MNEKKDLMVIAEGRLHWRKKQLYLGNESLLNILGIYVDGDITICISKERAARRRKILDQVFVQ